MTKRFDRVGEDNLHTQTLAAIDPDADSYEQLLAVCRKLALPESDCQEVFRRMVFNILSNNTDDHHRNFSFVMRRDGSWRLSPAYDLNYIYDIGYFDPDEYHSLSIRAKRSHITRKDVTEFARDNGIQNPDAVIQDVVEDLKQFRAVALKNEVSDGWIESVEQTIMSHLKEWNEFEDYFSIICS